MSIQRTLEQERAALAWTCVQDIQEMPKRVQEEYRGLALNAPADIQTNGLGQTLAFWRAKGFENTSPRDNGENADYLILQHVLRWLKHEKSLQLKTTDLVEWVSNNADVTNYRRATTETIAFLVWIKRFAEAALP